MTQAFRLFSSCDVAVFSSWSPQLLWRGKRARRLSGMFSGALLISCPLSLYPYSIDLNVVTRLCPNWKGGWELSPCVCSRRKWYRDCLCHRNINLCSFFPVSQVSSTIHTLPSFQDESCCSRIAKRKKSETELLNFQIDFETYSLRRKSLCSESMVFLTPKV